jgi:AraC family transcriptional regulator
MYPGKSETHAEECNRADGNGRGRPVENLENLTPALAPTRVDKELKTSVRQQLNRLKLSALTLTETLQSPHSKTPAHIHDKPSICVTLSGQGLEIIDGARIITLPGGVIVRAPRKIHSNEYGAVPTRSLMIEVEENWLETSREFSRVFESYRQFSDGPVSALMLRIYRESRIRDSVAPVIVEGLMLEMLGHASRSLIKPPVRPPRWLMQARDLLHARFNDALNLTEVAHIVGVHPTHLARTFKKHYRTTVGEYLRQLRLDWATRQLSQTQASIAEIASGAGFYDQSHFSHLFKQHTGFTPAEFRAFPKPPVKS